MDLIDIEDEYKKRSKTRARIIIASASAYRPKHLGTRTHKANYIHITALNTTLTSFQSP